jgi:hypothetical protein
MHGHQNMKLFVPFAHKPIILTGRWILTRGLVKGANIFKKNAWLCNASEESWGLVFPDIREHGTLQTQYPHGQFE